MKIQLEEGDDVTIKICHETSENKGTPKDKMILKVELFDSHIALKNDYPLDLSDLFRLGLINPRYKRILHPKMRAHIANEVREIKATTHLLSFNKGGILKMEHFDYRDEELFGKSLFDEYCDNIISQEHEMER